MKSLFTLMILAGLLAGPAQAISIPVLTDCAGLIGNTAGAGTFEGSNATYQGTDKYADWAVDQILAQGTMTPDPSSFVKWNVTWPGVALQHGDSYLMVAWTGGQQGDQAYQLYDVSNCAGGLYSIPVPQQSNIAWLGKIQAVGRPGSSGSGSSVPDGGTTFILLGLALCGLAPVKRLLDR